MKRKSAYFATEVLAVGLALLISIPLYLIAINTFKSHEQIVTSPLSLPDWSYGLKNVLTAIERMDILRSYGITIGIGAMALVCCIVFSALAAYAVARIPHPMFRSLYWFYVSCIMIPVQSALIPLVFLLKSLQLQGTMYGISLVYVAVLSPFCIFMYAGFVRGIPFELEESAYMDGCSPLRTFFQIIFPLLKPATATLVILQFIYIWNDLLLPLVLVNTRDFPTVSISLYKFFGAKGMSDLSLLFGGITLTLVPILALFFAFQSYFVKGLSAGAVKG
ncbi:carbohydrate ABC transporter membrane protein 2, CUT1 family [Paenibacillus tianmuensis]|uniref:Carbohydrate ABC transporter membrane protein 2, CUT1 family n=1 Tax=Paenibacillus tianmuensis TaxID=624147 RepID=A0A1G4T731_9BACL|nr:carbohydrate ABC transporter permease [Paenibacillus tianmuensis]SCW77240.1 carbohydrate ABC transporter membrane protein 2, CUT1 family [Paenibacillus tianmuensis]